MSGRIKKIVACAMAMAIALGGNLSALSAPDTAASRSLLSPQLSTVNDTFRDDFLAAEYSLTHEARNAFIRRQIEKTIDVRGADGLRKKSVVLGGVDTLMIAIPGLLRQTGALSHVGLGRRYGMPVAYIDADIFNNDGDLDDVIRHESDEADGWGALGRMLGRRPGEMRAWIVAKIDTPATAQDFAGIDRTVDPAWKQYEGLTARQIAKKIHERAHPLDRLYRKYGGRIKINADYIAKLVTFIRDDGTKVGATDVIYDAAKSGDVSIDAADNVRAIQRARTWSWIERNAPELRDKLVMSLSMEGNIPEFEGHIARDANTKGGLGAYYGDKLEGLADIGMVSLGAQPGYSYLLRDGKRTKVDYQELVDKGVMVPVLTGKDAIKIRVWDEDRDAQSPDEADPENPKVRVEVYRINRGGSADYIFVSKVFDVLYTDDRVRRFTQELVFGKAVYELCKRLKIRPDILHLNEAHTVVAAAQMRDDKEFDRMAIVYTNHTIVPAGLEMFSAGALRTDIFRMRQAIGLPVQKAKRFIRPDGVVDFCWVAIQLADVINAVSDEHAIATKKLFRSMYGRDLDIEVIGVLNGSGRTWKSDALLAVEGKGKKPTEDELWAIHEAGKDEAFAEIEKRTGTRLDRRKLTAWAVRRLVDYKSQYPMLRFMVHLMTADRGTTFTREELKALWLRDIPDLAAGYNGGLVNSVLNRIFLNGSIVRVEGLGMQVVVGGAEYERFWVDEFKRWAGMDIFRGRFVYVPDSDAKLLKMQAVGADICITMPRPLEEACGTSDQRTGLNGGVNIAINGAGPVEWIREDTARPVDGNGFLIGSYKRETEHGPVAEMAEDGSTPRFYHDAPGDILGKCAVASGLYYRDGKAPWKRLMHNSYESANRMVTAEAMERRYAENVYIAALRKRTDAKTIYEMVVRDYYDEPSRTPGLIAALEDLPYIAQAGVKQIYLLGLMEHTGKPFDVLNPRAIDSRAGTPDDLRRFIRECKRLGITVAMVDWLANQHVSKRSPICREHPDRFLYTNVSDGNYGLDKDARLVKGRDILPEELARRVELGSRIADKLRQMQGPGAIKEAGELDVGGRKITYRSGDRNIRTKVDGVDRDATPVIVSADDALFVVSATDLVSLNTLFPRRWPEAAQPDLSHPDVIAEAIEAGRFWQSHGVRGFRVDAALSTLPGRVKENWGIDVQDNLSALFIREMRRLDPACFFLFEGFDRQDELMSLADNRGCASYSWRCRNHTTDALKDNSKIDDLVKYLRGLETVPKNSREGMVNLGPEHDAFHYGDEWAKLGFQDRNILYFLYTFLPGYRLIFDGELFGSQHDYRHENDRSAASPRVKDADETRKNARKTLFSMARFNASMMSGSYQYLETDAPWNGIGVARYDDDEMVIGAMNVTSNDGWARLNLQRLINEQVSAEERASAYYIKDGLILDGRSYKWRVVPSQTMSAEDLFRNGFGVKVGPKGCEIIRLRKVMNPTVREGAPEKGLRQLYRACAFSENPMTFDQYKDMRGPLVANARAELDALVAYGLVDVSQKDGVDSYNLAGYLSRAPPEVFDRIRDLPEMASCTVTGDVPAVRSAVRKLVESGEESVAEPQAGQEQAAPRARDGKGSIANALGALYGNRIFSSNPVSVEGFAGMRGYSKEAARLELNGLVETGLAVVARVKGKYRYHLPDYLATMPENDAGSVIGRIAGIPELDLHRMTPEKAPLARAKVRGILRDANIAAGGHVDRSGIEELLGILAFENIASNLAGGMAYEICYNESRMRECPFGADIVKEYARLLRVRGGARDSVFLKPTRDGALIAVYSYKSLSDRAAGRITGEGVVDMRGELSGRDVKIARLLGMAFAASNIRLNTPVGEMTDAERLLIEFIRSQCEAVTGVSVEANRILEFIRDLPGASPIAIDEAERLNRLTVRQLQLSA